MVAVVNGYVCFTTCDAKKAKQGQDPNAKPGDALDPSKKKNGIDGQPATVLGGALKTLKDALHPGTQGDASGPAAGPSPPGASSSSSASSRVDLFA